MRLKENIVAKSKERIEEACSKRVSDTGTPAHVCSCKNKIHDCMLNGLAEGMFVPSSTLTAVFQRSRHFRARFFPRPFLAGWVWDPD